MAFTNQLVMENENDREIFSYGTEIPLLFLHHFYFLVFWVTSASIVSSVEFRVLYTQISQILRLTPSLIRPFEHFYDLNLALAPVFFEGSHLY